MDLMQNREMHTRARGGRRQDLDGIYFRSAWEANYARYLNFLIKHKAVPRIVRWEFEADTFTFDKIKRGVRMYTPDFKVYYQDGHVEYHEVKGWDYPRGRTARKRMAKYHPDIKLVLIDSEFFKGIKSNGSDKLIPDWE